MDSSSENPHLFFKPEPDPSGVTQTDTWAASWSPDGKRIAYIQRKSVPSTYPSGDRFFVFTRKVDGSDPKLVVQDSRMDYFTSSELRPVLCWAPNGRLYFALRSHAQGDTSEHSVWSIAVNQKSGRPEGEARELLSGLGWIGGFSAATAVSRLVFWRSDIQVQVFVSDLDPNTGAVGSPRRITLDQSLSNVPSAWTADSKAVVYTSRHDGKDWIYRQKIDETTPVLLVQMRKHGVLFPRLSGEGSEILYGETDHPEDANAPVELMAAPIAGGTPRLIIKEPGINNIECAQSPSRLCILNIFLGQSNLFYLFDLQLGKGRLVAKLSGFADWGLSPDGSMLVLHISATEGRLRFVSIQSGSVREVVLKDWPMLKGVDWSADGKMVLIGSVTLNNVPVVLGVNIDGNARVLLQGDRRIPVNWVIPSPDGKYGALGVTTGESSVRMVENY